MAISRIERASDERVAHYDAFSDRKLRCLGDPPAATMILESLNVIEAAVGQGVVLRSVLVDERHLETLLERIPVLATDGTPVYVANRATLSAISGFRVSRGYFAEAQRSRPHDFWQLAPGARRLVVLEALTDVTNVGALFRSASALGADGVVLAPMCADPLNRRSIRVSMGTVFQVPWCVAPTPWPAVALDALGQWGYLRAGMALVDGALRLDDPTLKRHERLALLFGGEGWGLSAKALAACDCPVAIPMAHGVDSLNVAASSAVALWELFARGDVR